MLHQFVNSDLWQLIGQIILTLAGLAVIYYVIRHR
jgi:hypothetical protein